MQSNVQAQVTSKVVFDTIGYQYDSRDGELFLKEGYKYRVYTVSLSKELSVTDIDLKEEMVDAI